MSSIASILRHAEFVERLEARSGETLFWNPATGLKVALGSIDRTDSDTLASFGWVATEPQETTSILALLRLRWPKLESLHPDHLGRHLTAISATEALEAVPEKERGRVARWLIARGRAMGITGMAEAILDSGVAIRSAASAAPTMDHPTRYFIGADGRFAYSTSGNEVDGYKLFAHDAQGSGFTSREDVSFEALLTPSSEWSPLDWESAAALATATEVDQNTFASHPSLTSSSGILHRLAERSPDAVAQLASVEKGGLRYLLGEHHQQLRSRFLDAPRPAWINQICDQHNLAAEPMDNLRRLVDAWIALRTTDEEAKEFVLPAIRDTRPELAAWDDERLLGLLRESFAHVITNARRSQGFKPQPMAMRGKAPAKTDLQPDSVRAILNAHYGASVISTLEEAGRLNILKSANDLPAAIRAVHSPEDLDLISGLSVNGEVTLISNMLVPETVAGVFLHEVGEHAGLARMLGRDYGRVVAQFDQLLQQQDPYATWAAMRVPASTKRHNIPSERLAYLVERVANDSAPRAGGDAGYALGQECLANLRTWLFRSPTFRWLENAGAMDDFTLSPKDIAALAREAVNFYANSVTPGVAPEMNQWKEQLGHAQLDQLFAATTEQRIDLLNVMEPAETLGYLYSLTILGAPSALETIEHFKPTLAEIAAGELQGDLRVLAGEILAEANALRTRQNLGAQVERAGFAMWVDGTAEPASAKLNLLSKSPDHAGEWQLTNYHASVGALSSQRFGDPMDAFVLAHNNSFVVSDNEAPAVLRQWAATRSPATLLDNSAFREWFGASQVVNEQGLPLMLYHGTGASFEQFSADHHRSVLNSKYQGDAFHFTPSPDVASNYADASRNHMINKERMFAAVDREFAGPLSTLFRTVVEGGMEATFDATIEEMRSWNTAAEAAGIDFYDLLELGRYVEGSRFNYNHNDNELFNLFSGYRHYLPEEVRDIAVALKLDDVLPNQNVAPVFLRAEKVLFTEDREAARNAQKDGYDGFCYSGPDCVDGVPEWAVFSPDQIRNAITPLETQRQPKQGFFAAKGTTVQESLVTWSAGTHVLTKNGNLQPVVRGDHLNPPTDGQAIYSVLGTSAAGNDNGPVYLSISNPWIPLSRDELINRELLLAKRPGGFAGWLREKGYDGIQVGPFADGEAASWVILDDGQARTAPQAQARAELDAESNFESWFAGSMITTPNGDPLVCYHGTDSDFAEFAEGVSYFSPRWDYGHVMNKAFVLPVFLSVKNPYWATNESDIEFIHPDRLAQLKAEGYDAMIWAKRDNLMRGASGWGDDKSQIAVFYPEQIKSAVGNRGTFSALSANILLEQALPREVAFNNWFGDSKVVDQDGKPLVVYHGTDKKFTVFNTDGRSRPTFFTNIEGLAKSYAAERSRRGGAEQVTQAVYLRISNPMTVDANGAAWDNIAADGIENNEKAIADLSKRGVSHITTNRAAEIAEKYGFDGVIIKNVMDGYGYNKDAPKSTVYAVFKPEQIKSAVGNRGTFDPWSANILLAQAQSREAAFQNWFQGSMAVDAEGNPLLMYHGTRADFSTFGNVGGRFEASKGFYFTTSVNRASLYADSVVNLAEGWNPASTFARAPEQGANVMPVHLQMRNPLVITQTEGFSSAEDILDANGGEMVAEAERQGYDGILFKREKGDEYDQVSAVVFRPEQIKSAIGNRGTFDPSSANILHRDSVTVADAFNQWFEGSPVVDASGQPLVMYHGTRSADHLTEFNLGLIDGVGRTGDQYGTAAYFTSDSADASRFAALQGGEGGAVLPVYISGNVLNLDGPLTAEQQQRLSLFASAVMLPSDKARFAFGRTSRRFTSTKEAQSFFERQRSVWERVGDGMDRALPVVDKEGEEFVIHYTDFEALPRIQTGEDARVLFSAIGWDNVLAAGFDGVMMTRESGAKWVAMHNPHGTVKSVFNLGTFERSSPDIRYELAKGRQQAFSEWFGQSKVVGDDGNPLVVYHGTDTTFDSFSIEKTGSRTKNEYGDGALFFTSNPGAASGFALTTRAGKINSAEEIPSTSAPNVVPAYLSLSNPLEIDAAGRSWVNFKDQVQQAQSLGHDGAIIRNVLDHANPVDAITIGEIDVYVAFTPEQVKSALNRGTFDPATSDIRHEAALPREQAFSNWFGSSAAVDGAGKPLVLYHGTAKSFDEFADLWDTPIGGQNFGRKDFWHYLTPDPEEASYYAVNADKRNTYLYSQPNSARANVMPVYASIQSPMIVVPDETLPEFDGISWFDINRAAMRAAYLEEPYDGIIIKNRDGSIAAVATEYPSMIKSVFNRGTFDGYSDNILYSFAGENALTSPAGMLAEAKLLHQNGATPEAILAATGWSLALDGKWRFEIDDSQAELINLREGEDGYMWRAAPLGEVLHHPQLFAAYPRLAMLDANITIDPACQQPSGKFNTGTPATEEYFAISPELTVIASTVSEALKEMVHEIQHAIQEGEGFALGGNPSQFGEIDETSRLYYKAVVDIDELARENGVSPVVFAEATALIQPAGLADRVSTIVENGDWDRTVRYAIEALLHPHERYMRLAGEIEARSAAARMMLTEEQRRAILPSETEDRSSDQAIITWGKGKFDLTGRLMADVGTEPAATTAIPVVVADAISENAAATAKGLDMSTEARLQRARDQGFDTSKVWYHGSEKAGFTAFNTDGEGKTSGTGAFFTSQSSVARTYSGTRKDAKVFQPEELFENPDIAGGDIEVEREWVVFDSRGRIVERFDLDSYPSAADVISGNDLDEDHTVEQRYTVYVEGESEGEDLTREEAIEALRGASLKEPGNYEVFIRAKDIWTIDWEGRSWSDGPTETVWNAYDDGDVVDTCYSQKELAAFRERYADCEIVEEQNFIADNTDDAARIARQMGCDAALILNVDDNGRHGSGGDTSDVLVVFDSANIRLTTAAFDPEHSSSDDIRLRSEKAASNHQVQTQAFKQWFGDSVAAANGAPLVCYHGTGQDFSSFGSDFNWVSTSPDLANEYAEMRGELYDLQPAVMPVYIRAERPFDADLTPSHGRVIDYIREAIRQAKAAGRPVDMEAAQSALDKILDCAYREESGPHYARHNLWNAASMYFGKDGAAEIKGLLRTLGFDSIKLTEQGQLTYGALDPQQLKSAIANSGEFDLASDDIRYQMAYHGTPFEVDQFRLDKINTGEGNQSFGWGLYFTETKAVAEFYRNTLTVERGFSYKTEKGLTREEVLQRVAEDYPREFLDGITRPTGVADRIMDQIIYAPEETGMPRQYKPGTERAAMYKELSRVIGRDPAAGNLYQVELPEDAAFLFWDKPLEAQSELVQAAFKNGYGQFGRFAGMTGGAAYRTLAMEMGSRQVSLMLNSLGIRGTKYLDQQHRGAGEGSHNFVIWDESAIRITAANAEQASALKHSEVSPEDAPIFFSQLQEQLKGIPARLFRTGPQFKQWLTANLAKLGVKREELFWTGINEWLDAQPGQITKAQVLEYLEANGVQIEEVWHHDNYKITEHWSAAKRAVELARERGKPDSDIAALQSEADRLGDLVAYQAQYGDHTLPGGTNYRELLLTLPSVPVPTLPLADLPDQYEVVELASGAFGIQPVNPAIRNIFHRKQWPTRDAAVSEAVKALNSEREQLALEDHEDMVFSTDHWEFTSNVLAHIRMNERSDETGAKVLFVEEIQSDWGQEGKAEGFGLQQVWSIKRADGSFSRFTSDKGYAESEVANFGGSFTPAGFEGVPNGPFVTDTKAWVTLALKRVLRYAADNGFEKIAFINGQQAVDRFGLENPVGRIEYTRHAATGMFSVKVFGIEEDGVGGLWAPTRPVSAEEVAAKMGQAVLDRMLAGEGEIRSTSERSVYTLVGDFGISMGGEGMKTFYDEIVPQVLRDLMKRLGAAPAQSMKLDTNIGDGAAQMSIAVPRSATLPMPLFSMAETKRAADFNTWSAGTYAVDDAGEPLLVFRGQHGISDDVFHSRLGSLSFGDLSAAYTYATHPNNRSDRAERSRVIPAYLSITNPVIVSKDDPFISFSLIADQLGIERAVEMARELAPHIDQYSYMEEQDTTVAELLAADLEAVRTLDADAYLVFDSPKFVEWFKEAGFDGAIHLGNGETAGSVEYKVFSPDQVLHADPVAPENFLNEGNVELPSGMVAGLAPQAVFALRNSGPTVAPQATLQFSGSTESANQFALERRGSSRARPIAYGLPFADSKSVAQHFRSSAKRGNSLSTFAGTVLTAATVKSLREAQGTAPALKAFLQQHGRALARGESAVQLLRGFIDSTRARIEELEQAQRASSTSDGYREAVETLAAEQKKALAWLITHAHDFSTTDEVQAIGAPLHTDYLDWDAALTAQSPQVQAALAKTGFDGHFEVYDTEAPESREVFNSRIEAQHYRGQLEALGIEAKLEDQFPDDHPVTTGRGVYRALSMILGGDQHASQHLQLLGVPGIRHLTDQGNAAYVVFYAGLEQDEVQPAPSLLSSQQGTARAQLRLPLSAVEGVSVGMGLHRARTELAREAGQQRLRAKERHAELSARLDWCRGIPNIDPRVVQGTEQGIAAAQALRASLASWKVPSTSNTMPWDQPIGKVLAEKINTIVRVDAEKLHGQQAFYYLADTLGSNAKAQAALKRAGIIGAHEADSLVLWDGASKSLAEAINAGAELERFHIAYHGSSQQIEQFSLNHVGEGEGAQAYGYGLYFTQRKTVAGKYQGNQLTHAHWYEDRLYKSAEDMANAVAPEIASKHPELAGDVAGINALESAIRRTIHAACYSSQERYEARLAALDDATRDVCMHVVNGILPVDAEQKGRFFLMPPGGARALNAMTEAERTGLAEITQCVNWKLKPDMSEDDMQAALQKSLMHACDETLWITQLAKIEQRLAEKPDDAYLLSRKGDLLAGQRMAQMAQACVRAASPLRVEKPLGFGSVYLVDISIQPSQYLRLDLPFQQQSGVVQKGLKAACDDSRLEKSKRTALLAAIEANDNGAMLHGAIAGRCRESLPVAAQVVDEIKASQVLLDAGIEGIQYPDGEMNISGQGFNFVVFDDARIQVLGHTNRQVTSEFDEVPVYDWADTEALELDQLNRVTLR
ncbi:LPD23 domain-containing protein [Pseudomonas aeruginosa]|uniref:ADP-ribosyltransferase-containing protein n=1 Tax=Pseudomonas aeruginosa TaxID=287 RepID=UPI0032B57064